MEPDEEIQFRVDEQYENEKGVFTVVSIRKNEMVIQWANGEEIRTTVDLQRQIQRRRLWEQRQREKQAKKARSASGKSRSGRGPQPFGGFKKSYFKASAAGTTWRGRNQLGGGVTRMLPPSQFNISSWAVGGEPEVHWADVERHKRSDFTTQAKFFARVDPEQLVYGLYAIRPEPSMKDAATDWDAIITWLTEKPNEATLRQLFDTKSLVIHDRYRDEFNVLVAGKKSWSIEGGKKKTVSALHTYLTETLAGERLDLEIARKVAQKEAVERGAEIAADMADLFGQLMPVYAALVYR